MNTNILEGGYTIFWFRSRGRVKINIFNWLALKLDTVYSYPLDKGTKNVWRQNIVSLVFKIKDNIDLECSVKEYDYRAIDLGRGINIYSSLIVKFN